MHRADLAAYVRAPERAADLDTRAHKTILTVACSGTLSSGRRIAESAAGIWNADLVGWQAELRRR
jgi:hypothetical protein